MAVQKYKSGRSILTSSSSNARKSVNNSNASPNIIVASMGIDSNFDLNTGDSTQVKNNATCFATDQITSCDLDWQRRLIPSWRADSCSTWVRAEASSNPDDMSIGNLNLAAHDHGRPFLELDNWITPWRRRRTNIIWRNSRSCCWLSRTLGSSESGNLWGPFGSVNVKMIRGYLTKHAEGDGNSPGYNAESVAFRNTGSMHFQSWYRHGEMSLTCWKTSKSIFVATTSGWFDDSTKTCDVASSGSFDESTCAESWCPPTSCLRVKSFRSLRKCAETVDRHSILPILFCEIISTTFAPLSASGNSLYFDNPFEQGL